MSTIGLIISYIGIGLLITTVLCVVEPPDEEDYFLVLLSVFVWPLAVLVAIPVIIGALIKDLWDNGLF